MDVKAATTNQVEEGMSQSWLELIDEEENALLNEAVSHTIRQLSAELRSNGCGDREISKPVQSRLRINSDVVNNGAEAPNGNRIPSILEDKGRTEEDPIEAEEDSSNLAARKRPREDSVNSLPAKISRNRHNSSSSSSTNSSSTSKNKMEYETDPATLTRRQKDIDYGKNTIGYDRYIQAVPKKDRTKEHPKTPPKHIKYSRRGWDGMVKLWRKQLHAWDPSEASGASTIGDKDRPTE